VQSQIQRFLECIAGQNYATNTVIAYQADLAQLLEYLEQRDHTAWKQVTEQDILDYILYLREREYAPATVTRKMAAVSSFFRFLMLQGVIFNDPTSNISLPPVDRSSPSDVLSKEEVEQLLAYIAQDRRPKGLRDQVLLGLMIQAGFRPSELVGLDLDDVKALSSRLGSQGHASLQATLARYVREGRPDLVPSEEEPALFLSMGVGAGGGRLTRQGVWLIVKKRAEACGLERRVSPRSLRRTHLAHSQKE
jgi:integrase/recombinase XerD